MPAHIKEAAKEAFETFLEDPFDPSLGLHELYPAKRGKHYPQSFAVSVTFSYRAIFVIDGNTNVWYWIGSHSDYDSFIGKKTS